MQISSDYAYRKIHGVAVLVPITKNTISRNLIYLNETAEKIFLYCKQSDSISELADSVLRDYKDGDKYRENMIAYIHDLIKNRLIIP